MRKGAIVTASTALQSDLSARPNYAAPIDAPFGSIPEFPLVRERATGFGVRPDRVGMIGFSAGGVVTTELLFGPAASRPDFVAIIYGSGELRPIPNPARPCFSL